LPEVGGDAAYYVNPFLSAEIAAGMKKIYEDKDFAETLKEKGWHQAQRFTQKECADAVMKVYESLW
jgi:glycosyltransferase involved in cell wall biosynthesis